MFSLSYQFYPAARAFAALTTDYPDDDGKFAIELLKAHFLFYEQQPGTIFG